MSAPNSKADATNGSGGPGKGHKFSVGDVVLARVKGYPPWPGKIYDAETVPTAVAKERPQKRTHFAVRFFNTGDFAWSTTKDMNLLPAKEIKAFLEQPAGRKSSKLREAYETAQDPTEWEAKMAEVDKATKEWEEEAALAADNAEEDQLEEDEEPADEEEDGSKKRKRKESKPKETEEAAKKRKKAKLMDLKKKATGESSAKKPKKSAEAVESEDEVAPTPPPKPKASKPATKAPSEPVENTDADPGRTQAMSWRHKLQKAMLGKTAPAESDMPKCDETFKAIESTEMKPEWLMHSKLGRVMKRIVALDNIPNNDEFKLKERAGVLAEKWNTEYKATKPLETAEANGATEAEKKEVAETSNDLETAAAAAKDVAEDAKMDTDEKKEEGKEEKAAEKKEEETKAEDKMEVDKVNGEAVNGEAKPAENIEAAAA